MLQVSDVQNLKEKHPCDFLPFKLAIIHITDVRPFPETPPLDQVVAGLLLGIFCEDKCGACYELSDIIIIDVDREALSGCSGKLREE